MSDDGTREVAGEYAVRHPAVGLLGDPRRITRCARTIGIRAARSSFVGAP